MEIISLDRLRGWIVEECDSMSGNSFAYNRSESFVSLKDFS